jgi:hypothetical protein
MVILQNVRFQTQQQKAHWNCSICWIAVNMEGDFALDFTISCPNFRHCNTSSSTSRQLQHHQKQLGGQLQQDQKQLEGQLDSHELRQLQKEDLLKALR